ncbi:MAG: hypothetical protein KL863_22560 [Rhizobium sp.]|nr:hypothetical protein [Rhizobium sp.]
MAYKGGKEKRINAHAADNQKDPEVVGLADGGWVATWSSYGQDGSGYGIVQQRYGANGKKVDGPENLVPTTTTGVQDFADIAALDDGGWVVTWSSRPNINDAGFNIRFQAYNADGSKQGSETQANTTFLHDQTKSNVTGLDTGGWVVTWQSQDADGVSDIYQQVYNSSGAKLGTETLVNTFTSADQFDPAISALDDGRWVTAWVSYGHAGDSSGIYMQVFNANGTKSGIEAHVNTYTTGNQYDPEVTTLANGDFVVTWQSQGQDGSGYGIYQQRFDANGSMDGTETRVNTATAKDQTHADITALSTGGHVVTWETVGKNAGDIRAQVFDAAGNKVGKELKVNTHTNSEQLDPSVAALDNGRFVVTWQSYDKDGDEGAICQRVFTDAGKKMAAEKLIFDFRPSIEGNAKDNVLTGKDVGEKFYGKKGDDTINGKGGNDLIDGGKGNDLLIGGDGKDTFVFKTGYGGDTIRGFFEGDRIDLRGLQGVDDFDDLLANHISQVGADARIQGPDGDVLYIRHALVGTLEAGDFIFAV